jgi:hypothetical protein
MNKDKEIVVTRHTKIVHKVFTKMRTLIKTTHGELNHENVHSVLVLVMRDMRKYRLAGFDKKTLAIEIMTLLLMELGVPGVVAHWSAEVLERQLEMAYTFGFHKFKRARKKWFC